ncbi:hypothetical protein SB6413_00771 [Klebsiella pasteurii]|uniref:hypothetical protein n=1 Tax=Klebsiella pasteurii TaxID=2587529 RepID=UPI00115F4532|nr:hypothetical protein [Klebsiella pasteurii]VUS68666.1 hypothetical protein SB6413_00771 [Klebsiella pasteurii]
MKLNDYATIISCIAASASALAAIYAINQSTLQRRLSYKPQLHIKDYVETIYMLNTPYFDDGLSPQKHIGHYDLTLINIGNGAAQNIEYKWEYDFKLAMKNTTELFNTLNKKNIAQNENNQNYDFYYKFKTNESDELIVFKRYDNYIEYPTKYSYQLQYILPQQHNPKIVSIKLPAIINSIIFNIVNLKNQSDRNTNLISGPKLTISYQDSGGALIKESFESKFIFEPNHSDRMHIEREVRIQFKKLDSRWTRRLLQSVRKSYVDFINTHDFNKNR